MQKCLSIKAAEDIIGKKHAFELQSVEETMYFVADTDKVNTLTHALVFFMDYSVLLYVCRYGGLYGSGLVDNCDAGKGRVDQLAGKINCKAFAVSDRRYC